MKLSIIVSKYRSKKYRASAHRWEDYMSLAEDSLNSPHNVYSHTLFGCSGHFTFTPKTGWCSHPDEQTAFEWLEQYKDKRKPTEYFFEHHGV